MTYTYLRKCENRRTYQVVKSYLQIGKAIGKSKSSVKKYILGLIEKHLIVAESTTVINHDGKIINGALKYTLLPIKEAIDYFHEKQKAELEKTAEAQKALKRLEKHNAVTPLMPPCGEIKSYGSNSAGAYFETDAEPHFGDLRGTNEEAG